MKAFVFDDEMFSEPVIAMAQDKISVFGWIQKQRSDQYHHPIKHILPVELYKKHFTEEDVETIHRYGFPVKDKYMFFQRYFCMCTVESPSEKDGKIIVFNITKK